MRLLRWLVRALLFFVLFAFALNNQHEVQLKWFFGYEWRAPLVFIVLAALVLGCVLGVLGMLPGWWQRQRGVPRNSAAATVISPNGTPGMPAAAGATDPALPYPPRDGL
ncbi:MAG: lipopolysaccharide assembly protein LapA domain-containing protein [Burkholderiales bacterium]